MPGDKAVTNSLPRGKLHGFIAGPAKEKEMQAALVRAAQVTTANTKLVWEVFAGKGKLTASLQQAGAKTERFSMHEGWDFRRAKDRKEFDEFMAARARNMDASTDGDNGAKGTSVPNVKGSDDA